jgi:hypothetical protein
VVKVSSHYLTSGGWIESNELPLGAVETWVRQSESINDRLTIDYSRQWADPEWSTQHLRELRESFPAPESSVSARIADVCWEIVD